MLSVTILGTLFIHCLQDGGSVLSRTVPSPVIAFYAAKIKELEPKMAAHFKAEKIKMQVRCSVVVGVVAYFVNLLYLVTSGPN